TSGLKLDYCAKDAAEVAAIAKAKWDLGLKGGVVVGNPIPDKYAMDFDQMQVTIEKAIAKANALKVRGKNITPFLLAEIKDLTGGESFESNVALALNNAMVASLVAIEYSKLQ
ncbi:MAG: pseudouridine-5'-phosphate glycosidase, partial [Erysipelotrichaceae bacterium]|nr:pseudouridine-5'-phosphate glycosidase [Erysipelotrichaceae bacterium]